MVYTYPDRQNLLNRSSFYDIDNANIGSLIVNNELISKGDTHLNIVKPVNTNIIIDSDLDISGNIKVNNIDASGNITADNIICYNLDVSGTLTASNITLANDLDISGNLQVEGETTLNGKLYIYNEDPAIIIESTANTGIVINSNSDGIASDYNYIAFRDNNSDKIIIGYDGTTTHAEINKNCQTIPLDIYSETTFKQDVQIDSNLDVSGQIHCPYIYTQLLNMTGGTLAILPQTIATDISANNIYISNQEIVNMSVIGDLSANLAHINNCVIQDLSANNITITNNSTFYNVLCHDISANKINTSNDIVSAGTLSGNIVYSSNNVQALGNINGGNIYSSGYIIGATLDISGAGIFHSSLDVSGITTLNNTLKCIDVSANNIIANNMIINDISGNNAYFNSISGATINLGANIDISGKIEISNSISGLSLATNTIEMVKNSNINIYGQNISNSYGYNIGFGDKLYFAKYDGGFKDAMTIDASLNVGIGTTTPIATLHLECSGNDELLIRRYAGTLGVYNKIISQLTSGGNTRIILIGGGSVFGSASIGFQSYDARATPSAEIIAINDTLFGSHLAFNTAVGSGASSEKLRINNNGRIGIGTTNPTELLHCVSGNARFEYNNAIYCESDFNNLIIQDYNRNPSAGTKYGGTLIRENTGERFASVFWNDIGAHTINRYNGYKSKYFGMSCFCAKFRLEHNSGAWPIRPFLDRFTNNGANIYYYYLGRDFVNWATPTPTGIIIYTSTVPKFYYINVALFIDNTAFDFDFSLRVNRFTTGIETELCYTTQMNGQKSSSLCGIAELYQNDEIRLYFDVNAVVPQPGYCYGTISIHELY